MYFYVYYLCIHTRKLRMYINNFSISTVCMLKTYRPFVRKFIPRHAIIFRHRHRFIPSPRQHFILLFLFIFFCALPDDIFVIWRFIVPPENIRNRSLEIIFLPLFLSILYTLTSSGSRCNGNTVTGKGCNKF